MLVASHCHETAGALPVGELPGQFVDNSVFLANMYMHIYIERTFDILIYN